MHATPLRKETRIRRGYDPLLFTVWGLLLWFGATLFVRLAGESLLLPSDTTRLSVAYYGAVPVVAALTLPLYYWRGISALFRVRAAALIALPGMLLAVISALLFERVFPNLPPESGRFYASWLFWVLALTLLSGFVPGGGDE